MKGKRTKAQEIVNLIWGYGRYIVKESDLDRLAEHFQNIPVSDKAKPYVDALTQYITGSELDNVTRQLKFHVMQLSAEIDKIVDAEPGFLAKVVYPEDHLWSTSEIGLVLYGMKADPKVYNLDLPEPDVDSKYSTGAVRAIVEKMNTER